MTPNFSGVSTLNGTPGGDRWARVLGIRQTPARGMSRHVPPRSRRGGAWVLCGLHHRRVRYIGFTRAAASECPIGSFQTKKCIFKRGCCARCGEISCFFNEARPRERSDRDFFAFRAKEPLPTGVRTGCHYLIIYIHTTNTW